MESLHDNVLSTIMEQLSILDLYTCQLLSRRWHTESISHLYGVLYLDYLNISEYSHLFNTLETSSRNLGSYVQKIVVKYFKLPPQEEAGINPLLTLMNICPNVTEFSFSNYCEDAEEIRYIQDAVQTSGLWSGTKITQCKNLYPISAYSRYKYFNENAYYRRRALPLLYVDSSTTLVSPLSQPSFFNYLKKFSQLTKLFITATTAKGFVKECELILDVCPNLDELSIVGRYKIRSPACYGIEVRKEDRKSYSHMDKITPYRKLERLTIINYCPLYAQEMEYTMKKFPNLKEITMSCYLKTYWMYADIYCYEQFLKFIQNIERHRLHLSSNVPITRK